MAETVKKVLPSGISIEIRIMSIDDVDDCKDLISVSFADGQPSGISYVNKARTNWLRKGLSSVADWKSKNGEAPPDDILRLLSEEDRAKAVELIQECQIVTKKKPLSSPSMS